MSISIFKKNDKKQRKSGTPTPLLPGMGKETAGSVCSRLRLDVLNDSRDDERSMVTDLCHISVRRY